jgi:hypothetical protein
VACPGEYRRRLSTSRDVSNSLSMYSLIQVTWMAGNWLLSASVAFGRLQSRSVGFGRLSTAGQIASESLCQMRPIGYASP